MYIPTAELHSEHASLAELLQSRSLPDADWCPPMPMPMALEGRQAEPHAMKPRDLQVQAIF